jgi:hypothetical protein
MNNQLVRLGLIRLLLVSMFAFAITLAGNEIFYRLQKDPSDRLPREVELVIPYGTSQLVENGQQAPEIPDEMIFVVGDTLVVRNDDEESHQLGPLWVPAGSSASLSLDEPMWYSYKCSFQPTNYMGLEVRTPTTNATRLQGLLLAAPATIIFLFLYSLLVFPLKVVQPVHPQRSEDYVRVQEPKQEGKP